MVSQATDARTGVQITAAKNQAGYASKILDPGCLIA